MQFKQNDSLGLEYIKSWLDHPRFELTGAILKISSTLGDRMAVAIVKALYPNWKVDDIKLRKVLAALLAAFEYPDMIENESDRSPAVADCLLERLIMSSESSTQKQEIQASLREIYRLAGTRYES